jgi:hypothetical protein
MCGIGTGKSQSPGKPSSSAHTLLGMLDPSNTAPPAIAARPKKFLRDNAALGLEAVETVLIPGSPLYLDFLVTFSECVG